jgi:hypothetical protein
MWEVVWKMPSMQLLIIESIIVVILPVIGAVESRVAVDALMSADVIDISDRGHAVPP